MIGDRRRVGGTGGRPGTHRPSPSEGDGGRRDEPGATGAARAPSGTATGANDDAPSRLQRAALWMAAGTAVSRFTGLLRIIALAYALGLTPLADAYNLANTTPNMIYDIVLGGVLSATFIPVFVDRLATRSEREAWRAISSIATAAVVILIVMTVLFWVLAPEVISAYTAFDHATGSTVRRLAAEKAVASTLLRWFVPQVALYGLISLMTALLNTRRRFAAPMWVPIANNVVVIGVLLWFHALVPRSPSLATAHATSGQFVLLGLGTTAGVALQAVMLVPALRGVGLGRLRWRWDPRHEAVRTVVRLGGWTFGFVVANQVALYVVLALAVTVPRSVSDAPVSSYTYAYTFMQMPYAVVAVSIMSAVTPDLSERWATGDVTGFRRRLTVGLRATLAVILPAAVGMLILAKPAVALLLGHGSTSLGSTDTTGVALAMFSLGLPGFCAYLYIVRVLQSMQRTKIAFWLYLVENGLNVVLAVALVHPLGVRGLALSLSIAYTAAALVGVAVLRRWLGALGTPGAWAPMRRVAGASVVMAGAVLLVSDVSGASHGAGLFLRVAGALVAGVVVYGAIAVLLGGRSGPVGLLTGSSGGPTVTAVDRDEIGAGAGLGAAWGDTRIPVNPGPRIRIVPAPSSPERRAPLPPARIAGTVREIGPTRPAGSPDALEPARPAQPTAKESDNEDDPGERRWIGGTPTSIRPRPPR